MHTFKKLKKKLKIFIIYTLKKLNLNMANAIWKIPNNTQILQFQKS